MDVFLHGGRDQNQGFSDSIGKRHWATALRRLITKVKGELLPILEQIARVGKPLLVIAEDVVEGEAVATLVVNKLRGTLNHLCGENAGIRRSP
jgi:hypothetical protein